MSHRLQASQRDELIARWHKAVERSRFGMTAPAVIERKRLLAQLREPREWDVVVIGGGATGLGIAVDAAARGFRTALIEARDFASGTSSRSTKLIHGGVRYLAQGNLKLVREALQERALLLANAPALVRPLKFIVPCYHAFEREAMPRRAGYLRCSRRQAGHWRYPLVVAYRNDRAAAGRQGRGFARRRCLLGRAV